MSQISRSGAIVTSVQKLIPDIGPDVTPDITGAITVIGGLNITTDGTTPNTLEINVSGTTDHAVQIGNATNSLSSLTLNDGETLLGSTGNDPIPTELLGTAGRITLTPGVGTLTWDTGSDVATAFLADDANVAVPTLGIVELAGGNNIVTSAAGDTVTISVDGTTQYAVQVGGAAGDLASVPVGTDGQLLCGDTGGAPAFTTVTSAGGTIVFTPGAHTLNMEAGAAVPTSFLTDDTNSAVPALNVLTVAGGANIGTTSAGSTVTVTLDGTTDHAVQIGNAANSLTSIAVGNTAQVLKGNTGADPSWGAVDLTTDVSGFLPVGSGGTGVGTITAHSLVVGDGVNAVNELAVGATNQVLLGNTGADPSWGTVGNAALTNSSVTLNNGANITVTGSPLSLGGAATVALNTALTAIDSLTNTNTAFTLNTGTGAIGISSDASATTLNMATGAAVKTVAIGSTNTTSSLDLKTGTGDFSLSSASGNLVDVTNLGVVTLLNDLDVSEGGTGVSTLTSHGILMGNGAGDIQATAEPTDGQILIGKTGDFPQLASLTAGAGISVTPGAGTITIANTSTGMAWTAVTVDAVLVVNTGTVANKAGLLSMTLPATAAIGDILEFTNINTTVGLRIVQNANQYIRFGTVLSTTGVGGYVETTQLGDSLKLVCIVAGASTGWCVLGSHGNWTIA